LCPALEGIVGLVDDTPAQRRLAPGMVLQEWVDLHLPRKR